MASKIPLWLPLAGLGVAGWLLFSERKTLARGVNMVLPTGYALGYKHGVPIPIQMLSIGGGLALRQDAARAFMRMRSDASKAGVPVRANTAWRSNEYQTELYELSQHGTEGEKKKRGVTGVVAKPGFSNHQSGEAVDIDTTSNPKTFPWLETNAATYGYKRTVPTEKWHWEFQV